MYFDFRKNDVLFYLYSQSLRIGQSMWGGEVIVPSQMLSFYFETKLLEEDHKQA
jgi:hypothetical protein